MHAFHTNIPDRREVAGQRQYRIRFILHLSQILTVCLCACAFVCVVGCGLWGVWFVWLGVVVGGGGGGE